MPLIDKDTQKALVALRGAWRDALAQAIEAARAEIAESVKPNAPRVARPRRPLAAPAALADTLQAGQRSERDAHTMDLTIFRITPQDLEHHARHVVAVGRARQAAVLIPETPTLEEGGVAGLEARVVLGVTLGF